MFERKMALGDFTLLPVEKKFSNSFARYLVSFYRKIFGMIDIHSHLRWNYLKSLLNFHFSKMIKIGAGSCVMIGEIYRVFKNRGWAACFIAIEPYGGLKEVRSNLLSENLSGIKLFRQGAERIRQKANTFDFVLLMDVLEHVDDPEAAMKEASRVTKKGGSLVVSVPKPNYRKFFGERFNRRIGHKRFYTEETLRGLVERNGFKIVKIINFTGLISSLICMVWYRFIFQRFKLAFMLLPFFRLGFIQDSLFSKIVSSHMILKAEKL